MAVTACSHEGCTCEAREDGYCSDYCATQAAAGEHEGHDCHCGHVACEEESAAPA
ncbi:MAG: hypothetical protein QOJ85_1292 [Solirubrobacteraceae bacterium]|jgi:hypothetical protein|nr:hypothetical protein [Solirubrobacteraceae bacterium]MEA2241603.1 hypothetical protein [Solirubrobacteraceae bacterium]